MKVSVMLYGTLSRLFEGYYHTHGLMIEIPDRATVADLLTCLKISNQRGAMAIMEGRVLAEDEKLHEGNVVKVFQKIAGG
jgi:sulfur carrier protein ThiS